ncbi:MAG: ribulose-phosphate 3-epimerase [Candidatus Omnitrophica bacterium]|nr:ribulose-phosphate 3-epimerase [Candidatus Omnitrophota bacterium]
MKHLKVSASILCADFADLKKSIKTCEESGVDMLHVDVMDGHFVPNITVGAMIVSAIRPLTSLPIDSHLMIDHPADFIDDFISAGSDIISVHAECYGLRVRNSEKYGIYPKRIENLDQSLIRKDIDKIHKSGKKIFIVLNPETPLLIKEILNDIDGVLIMSVNPGFAKQKFMPEVLPKLRELREIFKGEISIDGGINDVTALEPVKSGVDILATASYFFGSPDPKEAVRKLKRLA